MVRIPLLAAVAMFACGENSSPPDVAADPGGQAAEVEAEAKVPIDSGFLPELPDSAGTDEGVALEIPDTTPDQGLGADLFEGGNPLDETGEQDGAQPVDISLAELPPPSAFAGQPCVTDSDCIAGLCAFTGFGDFCVPFCGVEACPSGWTCVESGENEVCMPLSPQACVPCGAANCPAAWCHDLGPEGEYCLGPCGPATECPEGFSCKAVEGGAVLCVPLIKSCLCQAKDKGKLVDCMVTNEFGSCPGYGLCSADSGLIDCDAAVPQQEKCDGKDNDCDSWIDENFPDLGEICDGPDDDLCMTGDYTCGPGGLSLACTAEDQKQEKCDGKDNDCDGLVDEDFPLLGTVCGVSPMCGYGYFACGSSGKMVCSGVLPEPEECDGADNDCDGLVDEDFPDENGDGVADCPE